MPTIGVSPISSVALFLMVRRVVDGEAATFSVTAVAVQQLADLPLLFGVGVHLW